MYYISINGGKDKNMISQTDRNILRDLAKKQMEYAHSEANQENIRQWYRHNAAKPGRPVLHLEMWTFAQEIIPERLRCEGEKARTIETTLYRNFLNRELFQDDFPVPDYFPITNDPQFIPFGLPVTRQHAKNSTGHKFDHHIHDLEDDFYKLGESIILPPASNIEEETAILEDIFGDILPIKKVMNCLYSVPTQDIVHIMSMETMYVSMLEYPEIFHKMMQKYVADTSRLYRHRETQGLQATTHDETLGQGSWCFNNELKSTGNLKSTDVWGYMDSQETAAISPAMFKEFIFPYYQEIASNYGMLSYGCCEPIHAIWDDSISNLSNLKKASISPWCDIDFMGERLCGSGIIFHRKPTATLLGVGNNLDEEALRKYIKETLTAAKGCILEITQRDVYTINHDINKARRYVEIIQEEIENHW